MIPSCQPRRLRRCSIAEATNAGQKSTRRITSIPRSVGPPIAWRTRRCMMPLFSKAGICRPPRSNTVPSKPSRAALSTSSSAAATAPLPESQTIVLSSALRSLARVEKAVFLSSDSLAQSLRSSPQPWRVMTRNRPLEKTPEKIVIRQTGEDRHDGLIIDRFGIGIRTGATLRVHSNSQCDSALRPKASLTACHLTPPSMVLPVGPLFAEGPFRPLLRLCCNRLPSALPHRCQKSIRPPCLAPAHVEPEAKQGRENGTADQPPFGGRPRVPPSLPKLTRRHQRFRIVCGLI